METKQTFMIVVSVIVAVCILAGTAILGMEKAGILVKQNLKQQAVDECSRNSKYVSDRPGEGIKTEEPIKAAYEKCMKDKGY